MIRDSKGAPPEALSGIWRLRLRVEAPVSRFLRLEAAGGVILLVITVVAMLWANISPESYRHLWETRLIFGVGGWRVQPTLHEFINDGLMSVFFLLVGMEIKREIVEGELSTLRRALLPVAAALGGMIAPAIIYAGLNPASPNVRGVAVPTATDIAFAVGVLMLLGKRVPPALRIFLLTLAVADDLGAILVINVFYSGAVRMLPLLVGGGCALALVYFVRWHGLRSGWWYAIPGIVAWVSFHKAGLHPTLAGVLIGLLIPSKSWMPLNKVRDLISDFRSELEKAGGSDKEIAESAEQTRALLSEGLLSPLTRIEMSLHGPVIFFILPAFALANAGVSLQGLDLGAHGALWTALGVTLGLLVGKPLGIVAATFVMTKFKLATLPAALDRRGVLLAGLLGGVGFTMANFTAALAFARPEEAALLAAAKLGILFGSFLAGLAGYFLGPRLLPRVTPEEAAQTDEEAERSDNR